MIHNELKGFPEIDVAARRYLGTDEVHLERLGETLTPIIDLLQIPEVAFHRGEILIGTSEKVAAGGAGTFATAGISNPVNSQRILVVEEFTAYEEATAVDIIDVVISTSAAAAALAGFVSHTPSTRDFRWGVRSPVGLSFQAIPVGPPVGGVKVESIVSGSGIGVARLVTSIPHVLMPGRSLLVQVGVAVTAARASMKWRERPARRGEIPGA